MNQVQPLSIAGIYEVCIGVADAIPQVHYWEQFGYRSGQIGELSASEARELYRVSSKVRSIRLYHQEAEYGLIRLMIYFGKTYKRWFANVVNEGERQPLANYFNC